MTDLTIISGGQTGADRAALDAAMQLGYAVGGWCPKGRKALDGRIPDLYPLREVASASYPARTRANVADSAGTAIFYYRRPGKGSLLTRRSCESTGKRFAMLDLSDPEQCLTPFRELLDYCLSHPPAILNVAGSRDLYQPVFDFLTAQLEKVKAAG